MGLKRYFAGRNCTVLLLDDRTGEGHDLQLQSISHGVIMRSGFHQFPPPTPARSRRPSRGSGRVNCGWLGSLTTPERQPLVPLEGNRLPFDFLPGQYLNLSLMIDGKKVNRSYTIASSPSRTGHCELTIKREDLGTSSRYLHNVVREGDLLDISAPAGRFTFTGPRPTAS